MPVDSKVGRRHWGWLILLVTFRKFQHFNLVSKIFQKLFKPLPCHKSIGKMLHAICISAVAVSLRWASCGPWASCYFFCFFTFIPVPLSSLSLSFISTTISCLPFSGRWHKMTHKGWCVVKPIHNQSRTQICTFCHSVCEFYQQFGWQLEIGMVS